MLPFSPCPPPGRGGDRPNAAVPSGGGAFAITVRRNKAYTQGSDNADSVSFQQFGPLFRLSALSAVSAISSLYEQGRSRPDGSAPLGLYVRRWVRWTGADVPASPSGYISV